jgi:sugar-specific transcriptional regulator TrmB
LADKNDLIAMLEHFNLDEIDAMMYMGLLQTGPVSVGNLAAKLDIERGKAYRSLEKLRNIGLLTTTMSNPIICTAVEPQEALSNIIQRKEDEFVTMKKLAGKIVDDLNQITKRQITAETASVSVVQGRNNIYSRIGTLIQKSDSIIYMVTIQKDLLRMYHSSIPEKIKICKNNGGQVRIITDAIDADTSPIISKMGASEIRIGKLPSKSRIIVESKRRLIMSGGINETMDMNDDSDSVLDSNSVEMVENMYSLCEHLWNRSKPIEPLKKIVK